MIWHNATADEVLKELNVDVTKGLPKGMVELRKEDFGSNTFDFEGKKSFLNCLLSQFKNAYIIVFLIVAVIYTILTFTGNIAMWWEPIMLFSVILSTATLAAFYQYESLSSLSDLSKVSLSVCKVLRDGKIFEISSKDLVPGDIVILESGNYIPADGRIIISNELRCDESPLTGEMVPVEKNENLLFDDIAPVSSRANMVFAGCSVIHGSAKIVVTQTSSNTELGRKAVILKDSGEDSSPIMHRLSVLGKIFSLICLAVCALYFILSVLLNLSDKFLPTVFSSLLTALSLIVAAIPETLTAVGAVIIALGIRRMLTSNIIPKNTDCIETLGGVNVICTDKTGVLTENNLTVTKVYAADRLIDLSEETPDDKVELLLKLALMCCDAGETDTSSPNKIDEAFFKAGLTHLNLPKSLCDNLYPRLTGIPFDFERKLVSTVNMIDGKPIAVVRGAAEKVLEHCVGNTDKYRKVIDELSKDAFQVICVALKQLDEIPANPDVYLLEENLNVAGLIALSDPLQGDALEYIDICNKSGIKIVMLTGDHLNTATAIAQKMGILNDTSLAISCEELSDITDDELLASIEKYSVFARVTPQDKFRIVKAWQQRGMTVAVTGNETFDAAALQTADIGCAMGANSTDVAKGVSDVFVTDGRFSGLVRSVLRCRGIFDNIRKCVHYLLTCNAGELLSVLFGVLIFKSAPLAAIQLLILNMLTDCGPAIALGMQPTDISTKYQAPQKKYSIILNNKMTIQCIMQSVVVAVITLVAYAIGNASGVGTTMAFATLVLSQMAIALSVSSDSSVLKGAFLKNKFLISSILVSFIFVLIVSLSPISAAFSLSKLKFVQFLLVLLFALVNLIIGETYKIVREIIEKNHKEKDPS